MDDHAYKEQSVEPAYIGSKILHEMNNLRKELNALPHYKGLGRLTRPPLFNYFKYSKSDSALVERTSEVQELMGDESTFDEETKEH